MQIKDLKPNPKNPRKISAEKLDMLEYSMEMFGDISGIIFNRRSGQLEGGHQRGKIIPKDAEIVIEQSYEIPTKTGTVAEGYVLYKGERFKYREVDWDADTAQLANLAANKQGGEWEDNLLKEILIDLDKNNADLKLAGFDDLELENLLSGFDTNNNYDNKKESIYTSKIEIPIYEPKNIKPKLLDLFNNQKYLSLIEEINNSDIKEDDKEFLLNAAKRHIVFNYEKIADYYAHSDKTVQNLMEKSALVIIDYNKAIEYGFVKLTDELAEVYKNENK